MLSEIVDQNEFRPWLSRRRRLALGQAGISRGPISVRGTVMEARRSESSLDRGIGRTFIEVLNENREVVLSMKMVNFVKCCHGQSLCQKKN
jgi:hypothetical protein